MGQCISRELNLERQTDKEKEEFFKEYRKRFHRQRAYAHLKLQQAQEQQQVIQVPPQPEFIEVVMPEMQEAKLEEEVVVEARSPSPPPPVIVVESQPPQPRQLNQPSYHLIRSIGPISNIAKQRKSIREASASRKNGGEEDDDLNRSLTFKRDSAVEARKSKISATPGQAIIQNLLNEYLPYDTGKRRDSYRLSASQDGSSLYNSDFHSPDQRGRFTYKDSNYEGIKNHSLMDSEYRENGNVDDLVERYAGGQRDNVRDNESVELRKLLKEEEKIKETVREHTQDNLSNKETSFPTPRHQEDRPKVQYYKQESNEPEFLEEDSEYMQKRLKGETLHEFLKRSTVFKREQS